LFWVIASTKKVIFKNWWQTDEQTERENDILPIITQINRVFGGGSKWGNTGLERRCPMLIIITCLPRHQQINNRLGNENKNMLAAPSNNQ